VTNVPKSRPTMLLVLGLLLVVLGVAGYFTWDHFTRRPTPPEPNTKRPSDPPDSNPKPPSATPEQKLAQADQLRKQGKLGEAAQIYRELVQLKTQQSSQAVQAVAAMLDESEQGDKAAAAELAEVLRAAWELRDQPGAVKDLFPRGLKLVEARIETDPAGCLALLDAVEPAASKSEDVLPTRQKILEKLIRQQADNVDWVSRLAFLYEQTGKRELCQPLLEPLANKLGTTDGARILGQAYLIQGKQDEAFALLQPYIEAHAPLLRDILQKSTKASQTAATQLAESVNNHTAPDFDFSAYDAASMQKKQELAGAYINQRLANNAEVKKLQEALQREAMVVPVVLDVGVLQLARIQRMGDAAEIEAELRRLEKVLLAVSDLAGDQDKYRLTLAQVHYGLGQHTEGRKLFDEVLQADGRKFETLLQVARLLGEWGVKSEAQKLLEEAYARKDVEEAKRQEAALLRSRAARNAEEQITWLERSNLSDPDIKAALASARGAMALTEGKEADAVNFFREAAAVHAAVKPETAVSLHSGGLALLAVYEANGERALLDQAVEKLEKSLTLQQNDGVVMGNVARAVLSAGLADVIGNRIDLARLKHSPGPDDLAYLYLNDPERQALRRQLTENGRIKRAGELFDLAVNLAPTDASLYRSYEQLLSVIDDQAGLATLLRRARKATPDLAADRQRLQQFWQGKNDEEARRKADLAVAKAEGLVAAVRPAAKEEGATFALAVGGLVDARLRQEALGIDFDADALIKLAEEAHKAAPSTGTVSRLNAALLARASKSLAAQDPDYAAMVGKARRSLSSGYLAAAALWRENRPAEALLGSADVRQVQKLLVEEYTRLPDQADEWTWMMLRAAHPDEAHRIAETINTNERLNLERSLEVKLTPINAVTALRQCWAQEAAGKAGPTKNLPEALKQAARAGVPLP
jgi:thioredoxin-like negative regulator of GroEL